MADGIRGFVNLIVLNTREFLDDTYRFTPAYRETFWYSAYLDANRTFDYFMWEHEQDLVFVIQEYMDIDMELED